jgi:hypothetical protein
MDVRGKADPSDRPQKMKSDDLVSSMPRSRSDARTRCKPSLSNAIKMGADSSNRPILLSSPYVLPVFSVDLTGDGKLGYGFTSADELEEVDIGVTEPMFRYNSLDDCRSDICSNLTDSARGAPN